MGQTLWRSVANDLYPRISLLLVFVFDVYRRYCAILGA